MLSRILATYLHVRKIIQRNTYKKLKKKFRIKSKQKTIKAIINSLNLKNQTYLPLAKNDLVLFILTVFLVYISGRNNWRRVHGCIRTTD